jgi:hypothetical protein
LPNKSKNIVQKNVFDNNTPMELKSVTKKYDEKLENKNL